MKLKILFGALALVGVATLAIAATDPVLMWINKKEVKMSEFEYLYKKNLEQQVNKEGIDEYINRFVDYKLKVAEAERLGYDTLPRIKEEINGYKDDMLAPFLTDTELQEQLVQEAYERMKTDVDVSHIMLPRGRSKAEEKKQIAKMDSIRNCILNGEDFSELVMKYSVDPSRENNRGEYGFISSGVFPYDFEKVVYDTPIGELSKPFVTDYGVHMVKVNGYRPNEGQVEVGHIMRKFPSGQVTENDKMAVKAKIDSIYTCIKNGESFEELAKSFSQDPRSAREGGKLAPFGHNYMPKSFEDVAFSLPDGEISEPIETPYGYHIIKKYAHIPLGTIEDCRESIEKRINNDQRSLMPIESKCNQIMKDLNYKKTDGLQEYILKEIKAHGGFDSTYVADVLAKSDYTMFTYGNGVKVPLSHLAQTINPKTKVASDEIAAAVLDASVERVARQEIVKYYTDNIVDLNPDYRNLLNEYRDGTLLFEVMSKEVWNKAKNDNAMLTQRFENNRSKYQWNEPHFKGVIICAKNDSIMNEAIAMYQSIKDEPEDSVTTALNKKFGRNIKMVRSVSKQGENEMVDYVAFGGKHVESTYIGYPVFRILFGRMLNQPEEMSDVKGLVASDYQDALEEEWIAALHKRHKVKIDNKVLNQLKKKYK
ncbi:MAG: peptidylprolyl isomerase [Muribaculaceae bacterium]|nr:peptidylprolyl isomerase [Muribaculaceae bacterium]